MATQKVVYLSEDGKQHDTLAEAEEHEKVTNLALALDCFTGEFQGDDYDCEAAAAWLLKTYKMERKENV